MQLKNLPAGKYTLSMFNNAGQELYNKLMNHSGGSITETIELNNSLQKGYIN